MRVPLCSGTSCLAAFADAEPATDDLSGQEEGTRVLLEHEVRVGGEDDPVQLEGQLIRALVVCQLSQFLRLDDELVDERRE